MREEHRDEAFEDHIVELRFLLVEFDDAASWDDRKVIRDLGVVKHALGKLHTVILDRIDGPFSSRVSGFGEVAKGLENLAHVVFRQVARVSSRISEHLVTLVQCLCQPECVFGGEGGFALKGGEVVELRRDLFGRLSLFRDCACFAFATLVDLFGGGFIPNALGAAMWLLFVFLEVDVDPFAWVFAIGDAELGVNLPVIFWVECGDFAFAFGEDGEGRGLHTACSCDVESAVT